MRQLAKNQQCSLKNEPWTLSSILGQGRSRGGGLTHTPRGVTNPDLKLFSKNIGQMRQLAKKDTQFIHKRR